MTPGQARTGALESAVFVFALVMVAEILLRAIPGLSAQGVDTVAVVRLTLFALACFGLGFWMQRRYELSVPVAAMSFSVGVVVSFIVRALREDSDGSLRSEDLFFTAGLALANWVVLLLGAVVAKWRSP